MGQVVGMDGIFVLEVARTMRIKIDKRFFRMFRAFEAAFIKEIRGKGES